MRALVFICISILISFEAKSQIDFTSHFLSSGRYRVKKEKPRPPSREPASEEAVNLEIPSRGIAAEARAGQDLQEPGLGDQLRRLWSGEDEEIDRFYRERIAADDVRQNRVEIQMKTALSSLWSKSNYSVRDYNMSAADLDLRSNVWFTPLLGLSGAIRFSLGGSLDANDDSGSMDAVRDEAMEVGVKVRRYFGVSKLSPSLELNLFYQDESFGVSSESETRLRTRTSGLGLGAKGLFPSSETHSWALGGSLAPRLNHQESSTGFEGRSGDPGESLALGLDLGGEWKFDRGNQLLYGLEYKVEKNLFDGPVTVPDPRSGETPSNVTATTTRLLFSLGYRWGR